MLPRVVGFKSILACLLVASCISIEFSNPVGWSNGANVNVWSPDATELVDWEETSERASVAAAARRGETLGSGVGFVVPTSDPIYSEIQEALAEVDASRRRLLARRRDSLRRPIPTPWSGGVAAQNVRVSRNGLDPNIVVIGTDTPSAITYADGAIVISRVIAEGLTGDGLEENRWALRATLAHELIHHYEGHAVFNWYATEGTERVESAERASNLCAVTQALFLPIRCTQDYVPSRYGALDTHPEWFEFAADFWTFYILEEMGAPKGTLSEVLQAIERSSPPADASQLELATLVSLRAQCMSLLDHETTIPNDLRDLSFGGLHIIASEEVIDGMIDRSNAETTSEQSRQDDVTALREYLSRRTSEIRPEDMPAIAYLVCAGRAVDTLGDRDDDGRLRDEALFSAANVNELAATLSSQISASGGVYTEIVQGIRMVEPWLLSKFSAAAANLQVSRPDYRGIVGGRHAVRVLVSSTGRMPLDAPFRFGVSIDGQQVPVLVCPLRFNTYDESGACEQSWYRRPLSTPGSDYVMLYVDEGAGRHLGSDRHVLTVTVDDCPADSGTERSACEVVEEREDDNQIDVVVGLLPNLRIDLRSLSIQSGRGTFGVQVTNDGSAAAIGRFEISAEVSGTNVAISRCDADLAASDPSCRGIWFDGEINAGESVRVDGVILFAEGQTGRPTFIVDACSDQTETPEATCAIMELNEHDNTTQGAY